MCAENEYARIVTKMASGIPTIPVSASHNNGDWLETDIYEGELYIDSDTGKIYTRTSLGIIDTGAVASVNIFNSDGSLPTGTTRTFDLDTGELNLLNGNLNVGGTGLTGGSFRVEVDSAVGGIVVFNTTGSSYNANTTNGRLFTGSSTNGVGLSLSAQFNELYDSGSPTAVLPTSVLLDVRSTTRGSRPVPSMTEAQRDAISSPADYLEITNTTRERKEIYKPFWGWHPVGIITPDWGYSMYDRVTVATPNAGFAQGQANGGTRTNSTFSTGQFIGLSTGATTNGESNHLTGLYFLGGLGKKYYKTRVTHGALSTGTDRFVTLAGYNTAASGLSFVDGMFFLYDEGGVFGTATASPNWLCVTRNGATATIVDSGVPVVALSSFQTLEILENGTNSSCIFKINGVIVHTATTGIPDSSDVLCIGERIMKQAGTTARAVYVSYTHAMEKYNTPL